MIKLFALAFLFAICEIQDTQAQYRQYSSCDIRKIEDGAQLKLYGYEPSFSRISNCGPGDEEVPFEFRIYYNNMTVLLNMQRAMEAAQRAAVERWLLEQENNFMEEINRQLGTKHTDFKSAQKEFFKNFEKGYRSVENIAHAIGASHSQKSRALDKEQEQNTNEFVLIEEWRQFRGICRPLGTINCPEQSNTIVRGIRLGSTGIITLDRLWDETLADFSEKEYESARNQSWSQGIYKIVDDGSLLSEMVNKHIAYYNRRNLGDKVFLMTTYLVQYNNRRSGPMSVPISTYKLPDFWSNTTLLEMGKKKAPGLTDSQRIFQKNFFENEAERCNTMSSSSSQGNVHETGKDWPR